jgi:hypothetical protein
MGGGGAAEDRLHTLPTRNDRNERALIANQGGKEQAKLQLTGQNQKGPGLPSTRDQELHQFLAGAGARVGSRMHPFREGRGSWWPRGGKI